MVSDETIVTVMLDKFQTNLETYIEITKYLLRICKRKTHLKKRCSNTNTSHYIFTHITFYNYDLKIGLITLEFTKFVKLWDTLYAHIHIYIYG